MEKIGYLDKLSKKAQMQSILGPIKEIIDKDLRNAVFYSDYSVNDGQVIINNPKKIYSRGSYIDSP